MPPVRTNCLALPPPNSCFSINLNDRSSTLLKANGGWLGLFGLSGNGTPDGSIEVRAITATPEPGTLLLLASGAGALCFRRRRSSLG